MPVTNRQSGTNVHEVADAIYRINTPVPGDGAKLLRALADALSL
jgi:hypothetical protein